MLVWDMSADYGIMNWKKKHWRMPTLLLFLSVSDDMKVGPNTSISSGSAEMG